MSETVNVVIAGTPTPIVLFDSNTLEAANQAALSGVERAAAAASAASAALSDAHAESLNGPTYANEAAGLAATTSGDFFAVDNGDGTVTVYLDNAGVAVAQRTLATTAALASTASPTMGDALIGVKDTRIPSSAALNLHKWIEGDTVRANKLMPSSFVFATDDAHPYLQDFITEMEAISNRVMLELSGGFTWRVSEQLLFGSGKGSGIRGVGGRPIIQYVGASMNPVTQDDITGGVIAFDGFDHAWGGLEMLNIVGGGTAGACHGFFVEGDITPGFKLKDIHVEGTQLDGGLIGYTGASSPVNQIIEGFTSYPCLNFGGVQAVCGRFPLHFRLNGSVGKVVVRDYNCDNGVEGHIGITFPVTPGGVAGTDFEFENARFEQNKAGGDLIVLDYASGVSLPGTITIRGPKHAQAGVGTTTNFVRNKSGTAVRPDIFFEPFLTNDAVTNVYKDDLDPGKTVPYVAEEHFRRKFAIEHSADTTTGTFPSISRPKGARPATELGASATITKHDHDKTFTNNVTGANATYALPPLADVTGGFTLHFISTTGYTIALNPNASELVGNATTLTSSAARDAISIRKGFVAGSPEWLVIAKVGTWA